MDGIRSGHGQWDVNAIHACFDEFDDGDGELEVAELHGAFELLKMDPSPEEVEALLLVYDADGSGTIDKNVSAHDPQLTFPPRLFRASRLTPSHSRHTRLSSRLPLPVSRVSCLAFVSGHRSSRG